MAEQETLNRFVIGIQINGGDKLQKLLNAIREVDSVSKKLNDTNKKGGAVTRQNVQAIQTINNLFGDSAKKIDMFNKTMIASFKTQKNEIADVVRRVALWSGALGVMFGTISKLKQVYSTTLDLQMAMAELHKVMGDYKPYRKMKKEIFNMAQQYSSAAKDAFEIAKIWAQQGKSMADVIELTGLALRGINSANLTAAQSVEFLTSVTKTYNLEAFKTYSVLDGIMKVQSNYAVTAQNLAKGFMVAGKAAQIMGDDIGTVMGMITAIGQITRETGNKIGNSLKTQFARLSKPSTLQYLENIGIHTRGIDGNTLNARTIYSQIANKWKSGQLDAKIIDVAREIGGVRKFKDVLVLLDQWQQAEKARMEFLKAYGNSAKASSIIQDTLRKKMEKFNTILVHLGDNILQQTLIPAFSALFDVLNDVGSSLKNITEGKTGGLGLSVVFGMGGIAVGNAIRNKFAQGRLTDMMKNVEMTMAMRNMGMIKPNTINAYEGLFGLTKLKTALGKNVKQHQEIEYELSHTYKQYLNDLEALQRKAAKLGPLGDVMMRSATAQMMSKAARASGMNTFNAFFRGIKYGVMGTPPVGYDDRMMRLASFGKSVGEFGKNILKFGLITTALEVFVGGLMWTYKKITAKKPEIKLSSAIDTKSDISRDFASLASSFENIQIAAANANKSIEEYIKSDPDIYKKIIDKVVRPVGNELIQGYLVNIKDAQKEVDKFGNVAYKIRKPISTLEELMMSFRRHGLAVKDYNDALRVQMVIYKFIGNEILKQKQSLIDVYMGVRKKVVEEIMSSPESAFGVNKGGVGAAQLAMSVFAPDKKINLSHFTVAGTTAFRSSVVGLNSADVAEKNINTMLNSLSGKIKTDLEKMYKTGRLTIANLFDYIFTYGNKDAQEKAKKLIDDAIWKTAQSVAGEAPQMDAITSYKRMKGQSDKEYMKSIIMKEYESAIKRNVDAFAQTTDEYKKWSKYLEVYGKNLKNGIDDFVQTLYLFAAGLIKAKDKVFNVINQYDMDIKKAKINESLFSVTGLRKSSAQQRLTAFRRAISNLATISPSLSKKENDMYNRFDRIVHILKNGVEGVNVREIEDLKSKITGGDKAGIMAIADTINKEIQRALSEGRKNSPVYKELQSFFKNLANISAETFVNYGKINNNRKTFIKLLKAHRKDWGLSDEDMYEYVKLLSNGGYNKAKQIILKNKEIGRRLLADVISETIIGAIKDININFKEKQREINSTFKNMFFEGTAFDKIGFSGAQKISDITANYNDRINRQLEKITDESTSIDIKNIAVEIQKLEAQKQVNIELEKHNMLLNAYKEQLGRIDNALENFKQSTVSFLSDINTYNFSDRAGFNQGMKNWLGEMSSTVMQNSINSLGETLFKGNGRKFAAVLLGERLPEKPVADLQISALGENTAAIRENTMAIIASNGGDISKIGFKPLGTTNVSGVTSIEEAKNSGGIMGWFNSKLKKIKYSDAFYTARAFGGIGGSIFGNMVASGAHRANDMVGFGNMLGTSIAALPFLAGNPAAAFALPMVFGGLAGLIGTKMKDSNKDIENELKKINEGNKKIVENTAPLKAVDSRIINAPSNFVLPSLAKAGGNVQYINIEINGASDPQATAAAVQKVFEDNYNFNNVSSNI